MGRLRRAVIQAASEVGNTARHGDRSLTLADALLLAAQDGVSFTLERTGEGSLMDFFTGKIDKLPLRVMLDVEEDSPETFSKGETQ